MQAVSVDQAEIDRFNALARRWWDSSGPMKPLHMMNPVRARWILDRIRRRFGSCAVPVLDVGCGAGLLSEALARAGAQVLGLDAGAEIIAAAESHAAGQGLPLAYRAGTAEQLVEEGAQFPVITALEIIEHVPEPVSFLRTLAALLAPGGLLFISTLNRTPQSYLFAKLGAEYLLRLLPVGTHDWKRFITPAELGAQCRAAGLQLTDSAGMSFSPLGPVRITRDMSVNYIAAVGKEALLF
jgi:2-polyprenyl-6-hydroxyphenyl methylase/3-demethylubiquinone-9 3-methyltransferase